MAVKLKDILNLLEEIAPSHTAEEWDNPGLQVGDPSQKISKVFISVDPTLEALKRATKRNAQLLFTHHPLIFKPISRIHREIYPGDVIFEALKRDISIVAAHTNLDVIKGGINDMLAILLNLRNVVVLLGKDGLGIEDVGLGRIGDLPRSLKLSTIKERVKATFGTRNVKILGRNHSKVKRVAVVGGAGGGLVAMAVEKGADLLITGDIRHHDALEAKSSGLSLIDAGHFFTEKAALKLFVESLRKRLIELRWKIVIEFFEDEKDPIRFG